MDKGILIAGLFLDGAKWNVNENTLEESSPKQRFSPLPEVQLVPTQVIPFDIRKTELAPNIQPLFRPLNRYSICALMRV